MVKRKRIGLFYESYSSLPAYVIYIQNIVKTLNLVDDRIKPIITIIHLEDSPINEIKQVNYPYIEFYQLKNIYSSFIKRVINKVGRLLFNKNIIPFIDSSFPRNLDIIFPYKTRLEVEYVKRKIVWKPDFQEYHLPIYFNVDELINNHRMFTELFKKDVSIVLSSDDAHRDYKLFFPNCQNDIFLLKFISYLPDFSNVKFLNLKEKYNVNSNYFVVSNQFWPHKNHLTVLKALKVYLNKYHSCDFKILFTGKTTSSRDPELFDKLKFYISHHNLDNYVSFTGFISREEQLCLMKNSLAVIQPSLFEGWSTVIEDVKAMNHCLIASSISVNLEQIDKNVSFFPPFDYLSLADLLHVHSTRENIIEKINYSENIDKFKVQLEKLFQL